MITAVRRRISGRLHHLAVRMYDDFHTWELTTPDGELITFSCYWQYTGSWPASIKDDCSCSREDLQ